MPSFGYAAVEFEGTRPLSVLWRAPKVYPYLLRDVDQVAGIKFVPQVSYRNPAAFLKDQVWPVNGVMQRSGCQESWDGERRIGRQGPVYSTTRLRSRGGPSGGRT